MRAAAVPILGALALGMAWTGRSVAAPRSTPARACAIEGWSIDRDPRGLSVRRGPSAGSPVVGRLPAFVVDEDGDYGPAFRIVGARGGWLHIRQANDAWRPSALPRRPVYAGSGWVHGSMVRVAVQSAIGRAAPMPRAAVVVDTGGDWLSARGTVTAVTDCSGPSARVRYTLPAAPRRGPRLGEAWFTAICGDQRTTCDGAGADPSR